MRIVSTLVLAALVAGATQTAAAQQVCQSRERTNFRVSFPLGEMKLAPGWTAKASGETPTLDYVAGLASDIGPYAGLSVSLMTMAFSGHGQDVPAGKATLAFSLDGQTFGPAALYSDVGLFGFNTPAARPLLSKIQPGATGTLETVVTTFTGTKIATFTKPLAEIVTGLQACSPQ